MPDTAGTLIRGYRVGLDWRWMPWDYTELFLQLLYGYDNTQAHELAGGLLGVDYTNFPHAVAFLANLVTAPVGSVYRPLRQQSVAVQYSLLPVPQRSDLSRAGTPAPAASHPPHPRG
ncbi:MAG: hypothetical protein NZ960_08340 [Candidatus Kapabacteria bacterium]|nr:hypothetical protein [Candidatus Kapabacteria bacterium]MDW8012463.1 hypothetical protein [Bacteroidota bacterium]